MKPPSWGLWYWPTFLILVSVYFLSGELPALFTNSKNTLSDYSWYELHVDPHITTHTVAWYISLIGVVIGFAVLVGHIWFRNPS